MRLGTIMLCAAVVALWSPGRPASLGAILTSESSPSALALPPADVWQCRVLSSRYVQLSALLSVPADVDAAPSHYVVSLNGRPVSIAAVGVYRRVAWAALRGEARLFHDELTLQLSQPVADGDVVTIDHAPATAPGTGRWTTTWAADAESPAIHVSQSGYPLGWPKRASIGAYLGTLGEWSASEVTSFVLEDEDGRVVHADALTRRPERGMPGTPAPYQQVRQADFSAVERPGVYRLRVPGLGVSAPFVIGDESAADRARTYALGLYHQRCGGANAAPFTRFTHDVCHVAPVEIPQPGRAASVDARLSGHTAAAANNPRHTAPRLRTLADALYPAVRAGSIDVHGGHHDAGDYGKYVINSAQFINTLLFATAAFPGAAALDNLGLPESGDGVSDLVQLSQWEVEFLLRMQDDDGGWFFLVQPRDRSYEENVRPDAGDPQVVFPKNTSATAAAVAALAQAASTPAFRDAAPATARRAMLAATRGWAFLQRAWAAHGRQGAYQRVTAYGDIFEDRDEIVWAATELFLATGDPDAHRIVLAEFDPLQSSTWRWNWWQLFEGYGAAARSYAFAPVTGRASGRALDPTHLLRCRQAIRAWADKLRADSDASAFGTSYPDESKRSRVAGWYFSENGAFDLMTASVLDHDARYDAAIAANMAFASGANPVNMSFVTGLGAVWPREVVSQFAHNDRRALPPTGLLFGNIQQSVPSIPPHGLTLRNASLPPDENTAAPVPMYDRYADVFNTMGEATIVDQARALAVAAARMGTTPLAAQAYQSVAGRVQIDGVIAAGQTVTLRFVSSASDEPARVVWEWGSEPAEGTSIALRLNGSGPLWVEAEAHWRDGRRSVAVVMLDPRR